MRNWAGPRWPRHAIGSGRGCCAFGGALSTPLLIGTVVVLLLGPPLAFLWSIVLFVVLFLGVEAAARGRSFARPSSSAWR